MVGRIEHFVGRRMMNIDGIGEETAQLLFDQGMIKNIADLYDLTLDEIAMLDRFANRSAERILQGLEASKSVPFERVLFALSIPFVGETTAKKIARKVGNIDRLMEMNNDELMEIDDVGSRIAESIIDYFAEDCNKEIINRLRKVGLQFALPEEKSENRTNKLQGKSVVISGTFAHHSRDEYKTIIEMNGGKNVGSISKKTDYVLAGENMGPAKYEKATSLGIEIIDEDTFLKLIE